MALEREQENQRGVNEEDENAKSAQQPRGWEFRLSDLDAVIRDNTQDRQGAQDVEIAVEHSWR